MIREGFKIFWDNPIFGGGEKYFGSKTTTGYAYSHCNYTELLCNFGLVGTAVFYGPYFHGLYKIKKYDFPLKNVVSLLLIASLITQWMMVSYSGGCMDYIPIMLCFAAIRVEEQNWKNLCISNERRNNNVQDANLKTAVEN